MHPKLSPGFDEILLPIHAHAALHPYASGMLWFVRWSRDVLSAHQFRHCGVVALSRLDGISLHGLPVLRDEKTIREGEVLS